MSTMSAPALGSAEQTAADRRRLERARLERDRRIVEHGMRMLAALRQRTAGQAGRGARRRHDPGRPGI